LLKPAKAAKNEPVWPGIGGEGGRKERPRTAEWVSYGLSAGVFERESAEKNGTTREDFLHFIQTRGSRFHRSRK